VRVVPRWLRYNQSQHPCFISTCKAFVCSEVMTILSEEVETTGMRRLCASFDKMNVQLPLPPNALRGGSDTGYSN
jgi:hypothetical protein